MNNGDEINALRSKMAREAAAGNYSTVEAIKEAIEDLESESDDDDDYGDEEE